MLWVVPLSLCLWLATLGMLMMICYTCCTFEWRRLRGVGSIAFRCRLLLRMIDAIREDAVYGAIAIARDVCDLGMIGQQLWV